MIKGNGAIWYIGRALLNRLALLQRAEGPRAAFNQKPSLIPFLQSKLFHSAVGERFSVRDVLP